MEDGGNEEKRATRSGRKLSGAAAGTKRKRTDNEGTSSGRKMPKTAEETAPAWFTTHLNTAMETNRNKIAADTAATVEKLSATLNEKIEKTNQSLAKHKHDVNEIMRRMQNDIDKCIGREETVQSPASYALSLIHI